MVRLENFIYLLGRRLPLQTVLKKGPKGSVRSHGMRHDMYDDLPLAAWLRRALAPTLSAVLPRATLLVGRITIMFC